ncbi:MAG: hypothetical protein ACM3IH_05645 [Sphingobacteriales bacterium]
MRWSKRCHCAWRHLCNPAETGFVAASIEEIGSLLETLLLLPEVRRDRHNAG